MRKDRSTAVHKSSLFRASQVYRSRTRFPTRLSLGRRMRGPRGVLSGVGAGVGVAVGVGVGTGVGVDVGVGVGSGVGVGVGAGVGVGVGAGVGVGVGVAVGVGVGVGVGVSLAAPDCAAFKASISQPKALPSVPADL